MKQPKKSPRRPGGTGTRSSRNAPRQQFYLSPARQEEIAAVTLLGIALLTALGAFNLSGGNILDGWTKTLSILFGWGRVLAPLFFGGLGVWLLLDSLDLRPDIGWERPFGFVLIFLILLTVFHIPYAGAQAFATASRGEGGGLIGYALSDFMVGAIGELGTLLILFIALCIALILLFNIPLTRVVAIIATAFRRLEDVFVNQWRLRGRGLPRNHPGRTPIEMVTAPPRTNDRASRTFKPDARELPPRSPAAEWESPPTVGSPRGTPLLPRNPAVAARIVGGAAPTPMVHREWRLPNLQEMLEESNEHEIPAQEIRQKVKQIEETLIHFGVPAKVIEVNQGPTITQFGVEPGFLEQKGADGSRRVKVKVSRISALQHDLELALAAAPIRVEAPVPGKSIVGIEVPNSQNSLVSLRGVMESEEFTKLRAKSDLATALGQDVSGQPMVADLGSMPHLLIAGATGSGKSVCVNALIACLLITNTPDDLKFVMVDPKRVELSNFNSIPHLLAPVVVEMDLAVAALQRAVHEMDNRFKAFAKVGARNIEAYHQLTKDKPNAEKLPYLVLVVDELADLMLIAANEVEKAITRLAQMARATGIHLVLATQRPSVDVVTGLIKANFPSRISFAVTSSVDSRVVLDTTGAETLLGKGDMLYMASDSSKLFRLQGCFVSDRELERLVSYWQGFIEQPARPASPIANAPIARVSPSSVDANRWTQGGLWNDLSAHAPGAQPKAEEDELLEQAIQVVKLSDRASISLLQRKLRIGYSRAAKLMDLLEQKGYVGPDEGSPSKGREILTKGNLPTISGKTPTPSTPPEARTFESDESYDDWTDEDWADLDKE